MKFVKLIAIIATAMFATSAYGQKFAIVNSQEIMQLMVVKDSVDVKLKAYQEELVQQHETMVAEFQTKAQELQQKLATMSDAIAKQKEKELQRLQQDVQDFEKVAQQEIQTKQQTLMAPALEKIQAAIKQVGKQSSYTFVLDSVQPLYVNESTVTDITAQIKTVLGL